MEVLVGKIFDLAFRPAMNGESGAWASAGVGGGLGSSSCEQEAGPSQEPPVLPAPGDAGLSPEVYEAPGGRVGG